jgi:hypothetical protein
MNKKAATWIFGVAASISAIASVIALNFETYFSRNSNDPDLIQAYCMFGGVAMFLLSFFIGICAVWFQLLKSSEE